MTQLTHHVETYPIAPCDETAMREWFDLEWYAQVADRPDDAPPCWIAHRARLRSPWPGEESHAWLARAGDEVVGVGVLDLPQLDNTDTALCDITVAPAHRRRMVGRRLLALLTDEARRAGRVRLIGEVHAPLAGTAPGPAFAAAAGASEALTDLRQRLHLPAGDEVRDRLAEQAHAAATGYDLLQWTDGTPDEWLDDIARLTGRISTDAPLGELSWAPECYDAQRVRDRDAMCRDHGIRVTVTAARAPDGRLAAFTEIAATASVRWHAANWYTLVAPEHRGRRLGLRVKLANLTLARERLPELRAVDTDNAVSNTHMIAINEAMGFRPLDRIGEWQLDL